MQVVVQFELLNIFEPTHVLVDVGHVLMGEIYERQSKLNYSVVTAFKLVVLEVDIEMNVL